MSIIVMVRLALTAALLAGVYSETGVWTTVMVGGLAAANELHNIALARSR